MKILISLASGATNIKEYRIYSTTDYLMSLKCSYYIIHNEQYKTQKLWGKRKRTLYSQKWQLSFGSIELAGKRVGWNSHLDCGVLL